LASVARGSEFLAARAINVDAPGQANAGAAYVFRWGPALQPPAAQDDNSIALEDTWQPVDVLANDSDPEGGALTVVAVSDPPNGTTLFSNDMVGYLSNPNYHGSDVFTYTIADSDVLTGTAKVTMDVQPMNDWPVDEDDSTGALMDTPVSIPVLDNDSDVDGDPLSISAVTDPANGTAVISGTEVVYTPDTSFLGTDTFTHDNRWQPVRPGAGGGTRRQPGAGGGG
jgi:hypothetical protein